MDPNATLAALRALVRQVQATENGDAHADTAERMAELFSALDQWLCRGGFLPRVWNPMKR